MSILSFLKIMTLVLSTFVISFQLSQYICKESRQDCKPSLLSFNSSAQNLLFQSSVTGCSLGDSLSGFFNIIGILWVTLYQMLIGRETWWLVGGAFLPDIRQKYELKKKKLLRTFLMDFNDFLPGGSLSDSLTDFINSCWSIKKHGRQWAGLFCLMYGKLKKSSR